MTTTTNFEMLMRAAVAGDARAYQDVLQQSAQLLRPYLIKKLGGHAEIDDVLQEILTSLHRARHTYDGERPFLPWLWAIARFRLKDHLRRMYRDRLRHADDISDMADFLAAPVTENGDGGEFIGEILQQLPKKQAMILQFIHVQGLTTAETGVQMGMSQTAVKVAAHRAYKTLHKKMGAA
jgi:RNA polymerase sigma-70 factor (ECF subfamily)